MLDFCSYAERFLSTPSVRRATAVVCARSRCSHFYPRPPRGGRLAGYIGTGICRAFLSTPSVRRATPVLPCRMVGKIFLSTPSARRATTDQNYEDGRYYISIHALREEGDGKRFGIPVTICEFLSTPSARRATAWERQKQPRYLFLSTPSARRATVTKPSIAGFGIFLSTPSARRATAYLPRRSGCQEISIHALREEGDVLLSPAA